MSIKRTPLDIAVSMCVRESVNWTCERCHKYFPPGRGRAGIHNSHFYGRGGQSVRYFLDNCDCLCYGCHKYMERSRDEYTAFKRKKLGDTRFDALVLRANKPRKYTKADKAEMTKHYRSELSKMEFLRANGERGYIEAISYD